MKVLLPSVIYANIQKRAEVLGLSLRGVARRANICSRTISAMKSTDYFPTLPVIYKISQVLHVSVESLCFGHSSFNGQIDYFVNYDAKRVGENIKSVRLARGIMQKDAAEESGICVTTIRNIEKGAPRMHLFTIFLLAQYYECTIDELIGRVSTNGI